MRDLAQITAVARVPEQDARRIGIHASLARLAATRFPVLPNPALLRVQMLFFTTQLYAQGNHLSGCATPHKVRPSSQRQNRSVAAENFVEFAATVLGLRIGRLCETHSSRFTERSVSSGVAAHLR